MQKLIPFNPEDVKKYLDNCIHNWRKNHDIQIREYYIDAYQSVRMSLFGERLWYKEKKEKEVNKIDELNKKIEELNKRMKEFNKAIDEIVNEINEINKSIEKLDKQIEEVVIVEDLKYGVQAVFYDESTASSAVAKDPNSFSPSGNPPAIYSIIIRKE